MVEVLTYITPILQKLEVENQRLELELEIANAKLAGGTVGVD